jgi:ABC-2 type transport system permease protein
MDNLRIYFKLVGMALKSMTQFRLDFLVGVAGVIIQNGVNLAAIGVLLERFHDLAGWTAWEIVFLYGIWMTGNSLYSLLFLHLTYLDGYIIEGTFDRFLVRPISPFLQLIGEDVNLNGIADGIFGLACLGLSMTNLGLAFNPLQWAYLVTALLCAALIELGITLFFASTAFWTGRSAALINTVNQVNWNMTQQYPLEMFGRSFRVFVTCFIPVAFLNYYPARWLLGKIAPGAPGYWLSFLPPAAAVLALAAARLLWRRGLRQYTSTGS